MILVINMNCENYFCIYEKDGVCILDNIELDLLGQCKECIYVDIDPDLLKKKKQKAINKLK